MARCEDSHTLVYDIDCLIRIAILPPLLNSLSKDTALGCTKRAHRTKGTSVLYRDELSRHHFNTSTSPSPVYARGASAMYAANSYSHWYCACYTSSSSSVASASKCICLPNAGARGGSTTFYAFGALVGRALVMAPFRLVAAVLGCLGTAFLHRFFVGPPTSTLSDCWACSGHATIVPSPAKPSPTAAILHTWCTKASHEGLWQTNLLT